MVFHFYSHEYIAPSTDVIVIIIFCNGQHHIVTVNNKNTGQADTFGNESLYFEITFKCFQKLKDR